MKIIMTDQILNEIQFVADEKILSIKKFDRNFIYKIAKLIFLETNILPIKLHILINSIPLIIFITQIIDTFRTIILDQINLLISY